MRQVQPNFKWKGNAFCTNIQYTNIQKCSDRNKIQQDINMGVPVHWREQKIFQYIWLKIKCKQIKMYLDIHTVVPVHWREREIINRSD